MAIEKKNDWIVDHRFDPKSCRHFQHGVTQVLHCHHYASLYCQLADDAEMFDGKGMLRKAAEMSFHRLLADYFAEHEIVALEDRLWLAAEYWRLSGMGLVSFEKVGPISATARMDKSHVDEGWRKKWGERPEPVNFIGQGFVAAALAAAYGKPAGSFAVVEVQSIVAGAESSRFRAVHA